MNSEKWDYKDYEDSFQIIDEDEAGWALFWIALIILLVTDFGRIFG